MNCRPDQIYVARAVMPDGLYKVGSASNVARRFRHICNGSPVPMELLGTCAGDSHVEGRIHAFIRGAHVRCEWFRESPEVLQVVEWIRAGTVPVENLPPYIGITSMVGGVTRTRRSA